MSEPFPNEYTIRRVADSESKACTVCYKPSTTVMLNQNKADFFYVCASHLDDVQFAESIKEDSYKALVKTSEELKSQLEVKQKLAESLKPYLWNKLKGTENKEYDQAVEEVSKLTKESADANEAVSSFKFKRYTLNKDVYKMRTQGIVRARNERKRQERLQTDPGFFPKAPAGQL